ncbi:hypothetical protein PG997_007246 [Apiospora hydei]|uniref:O-methyltransferase C-terminal domain-containing protein n=1 Tax=Apiospora hydei TaxID=1337664 RepID=A0ABR1WB98_9PEZI
MEKVARDAALEHTAQIRQLVHDPSSFLTDLHIQQQQYYSIQWLSHFNILSNIPLPPHETPYAAIAAMAAVPESTLRSVARMAMTAGFLCETPSGRVSHNALSASFVEDAHMRVQLEHMFNATIPVMAGLVKATERWGDSRAPNETAYNVANSTELPFFAHLKSRPELQKKFEDYMKSRAVSHTGSRVEHLLDAFDWAASGVTTVVDVGGSSGSTAIMLAGAHPQLQITIQDLAGPIANAQAQIAALPDQAPQQGADVYLLRTILHDWPDADAARIVRGLADAMAPASSRLLVMDMVLPKPGSGSGTHEAALRQKDLMMLGTFNAKEREEDEWVALFREADPRLRIRAIHRPTGSELSVIEVYLGQEQ